MYSVASAGVNVAVSVWAPTESTVPAAGWYTTVPATLAVAFNCVAPSGAPWVSGAGDAHERTGVVRGSGAGVPTVVSGGGVLPEAVIVSVVGAKPAMSEYPLSPFAESTVVTTNDWPAAIPASIAV